jgi:formamidopyrimidine-DNA glycosylase
MHLGMTGQIQVFEGQRTVGPHDHMDIELDNGRTIRYFDPRRFGIVDWTDGQTSEPPSATLGPEPLTGDFTPDTFYKFLQKTAKIIKVVLMDGKSVVGVGNIYAAEALFRAKIHPDAPAKTLTLTQVTALHKAIVEVLTQAVSNGGSTLRDYRKPDGSMGDAQSYHFVYDRAHLPCLICKASLKIATHAGRATYWCPKCQPWKASYVIT